MTPGPYGQGSSHSSQANPGSGSMHKKKGPTVAVGTPAWGAETLPMGQ